MNWKNARLPAEVDVAFRAYCDNIAEAQILFDWLDQVDGNVRYVAKGGSPQQPIHIYHDRGFQNTTFAIQVCPGYDRWEFDPKKGIFSESPDLIVTHISASDFKDQSVVFAFEDSSATQVGNQAQQRFRRALDAARKGIPYIYRVHLVGAEFESDSGEFKSIHYHKPRITLGHLSLMSKFGELSAVSYQTELWATHEQVPDERTPNQLDDFADSSASANIVLSILRQQMAEQLGINIRSATIPTDTLRAEDLTEIIRDMLRVARFYTKSTAATKTKYPIYTNHALHTGDLEDITDGYTKLVSEGEKLCQKYTLHDIGMDLFESHGALFRKDSRTGKHFTSEIKQYLNSSEIVQSDDPDLIKRFAERWGITTRENTSWPGKRLDLIKDEIFEHKGTVPITYKSNKSEFAVTNNRSAVKDLLNDVYSLEKEVLNWISGDSPSSPIVIVPIQGIKPSGAYSDPDSGLLPLLYTLFPQLFRSDQLLVIVYGTATPADWQSKLLASSEERSNIFWDTLRDFSGCIIADVHEEGLVL